MSTLSVPEMTCGHCKASVEAALKPISTEVEVDLAAKRVRIEGATPEAAIAALDEVGFTATRLD
ncbi:heavy-metal-associated domain-containing protein [Xinfangfangia sp. D13-10-4-6]|uniref:heavy-metal-associated domain-containing protein n=1 Tax=Pseudogemmobacter hezensis TaxID=2737662 RepID=UPI0015520DE8|nr:cation transporter [Pseudogemmobacter hezensis]NPD15907.1 heavy-metal-associated domain-containing protein [Pseudogemmobacter hezensis]